MQISFGESPSAGEKFLGNSVNAIQSKKSKKKSRSRRGGKRIKDNKT